MKHFFDFFIYGIVVAGILVLTRKGSQGPAFLKQFYVGMIGFAQAVSGQRVTKQ